MRIGFIGLGIMGEPMCYNVIKKHDDKVYAFDIDAKKRHFWQAMAPLPVEAHLRLRQTVM